MKPLITLFSLLIFFVLVSFNSLSQSSGALDLKVNTSLLDVDVFGDSLFSVDVYLDYSQYQNADSIAYEIITDGQVVNSGSVAFENGFAVQKITSQNKAIIHFQQLPIKKYNAVIRLYGNGEDVSDSKAFGY